MMAAITGVDEKDEEAVTNFGGFETVNKERKKERKCIFIPCMTHVSSQRIGT